MTNSSATTATRRMPVPPSVNTVLLICFYSVVLFFIAVAVYDLMHVTSMPLFAVLASIAWLGLVVLVLVASIREAGGIRQYAINRLGEFSKRQFVSADRSDGGPLTLRFGYELFGREFCYLELDSASVVSVDWSTGQASAMAGRDMNDWHLTLWYRHPAGPHRPRHAGVREEEVYIFGPSGRKEEIEAFGRSFLAFIKSAGMQLAPGTFPTEFKVIGSPAAS